jgi:putative nucleotidyltransferase with HDIG domain
MLEVEKEQLCIGLYVHLDLPWMKHPFVSNRFKVRTERQLATLKRLNVKRLRIDPARSDTLPLPRADPTPAPPPLADDLAYSLWQKKQQRIETLRQRRQRLNQCANRYASSARSVRTLMSHLMAVPAQAMQEADAVVGTMIDELTADREVTVQLVNMRGQDESSYYHSINVAALALVLGKNLGLDSAELRLLGLSALFHDLGHQQIPAKILRKKGSLTTAELHLYQRHPIFGAQLAGKLAILPAEVVTVIAQHHELLDGSGYPNHLRGDSINALSRLVAIVNRYDNLCNCIERERSLSPFEAVSRMYAKEREKYDPRVLTTFIANLGVYPPGTLVRLSDGQIATVISINPSELLRPNVLVYDPAIPKEEALILDLTEEDLEIGESLRRSELGVEILDYLNHTDHLSYYFDRTTRSGGSTKR